MEISHSQKGYYTTFHLSGDWDTPGCFSLKEALAEALENNDYHICFDLTEITSIDASGFRFMHNIAKTAKVSQKIFAIFGMAPSFKEEFESRELHKEIAVFANLAEFEDSFTQESEELKKKYFGVAMGSGPIRRLSLKCPMCNTEGIIGYMVDETQHDLVWEEHEITPQYKAKSNIENDVDFELYEVAVCHRCFFSSARLEHFTVILPEGIILSILDQDQKERITKNLNTRGNLLGDYHKSNAKSFFSLPRETVAAFHAWQYYDKTLREIAKEKSQIRSIEVARANILSAKFASPGAERENAFTTAHVWLTAMVEHPQNQTTNDLLMAYIYLISVNYALDKPRLAEELAKKYLHSFGKNPEHQWYTDRVLDLLN